MQLYRVMHDLLNGTIDGGLERLTISQLRGLLRAIRTEHNDSSIDLTEMGLSENGSSGELFGEDDDLPESAGQILYTKFSFGLALLLLTVCLFGVLFNIVSIYIYTRPQMRAPINVLLTGLSAIDLLMLVLAIFAFVIPGLNVVLMHPLLTQITNYSTIYLYPLAMMAQTCSIWTLVLITVERYIAVRSHRLLLFTGIGRACDAF